MKNVIGRIRAWLAKRKRKKGLESDLGYNFLVKGLTSSFPLFTQKIQMQIWGIVIFVLWAGISLGWWTMTKTIPVLWIHLAFWALILMSIFLTGRSGQSVVRWLGLKPQKLRKGEITADNKPISLPVVRVVVYFAIACEIAFWIWWQVFTMRPIFYPEGVIDQYQIELITEMHYGYQFSLYAWLFATLIPICLLAVPTLERLPILNFILRRTRILICLVPVIAFFQIRMVLMWLYQVDIWGWGF